jgi:hypothetical protein
MIAREISRRHTTFVRPGKMDVVKENLLWLGLFDGGGEKCFGDPPPESATQWVSPAQLAPSISSSRVISAALASS